ncbi:MAG: type IX secretion system membrane protein PorP/SprF [Chitinophagaceae bacterium]|nr:MAG: type IX secretion system membrane protein PorP/SprF [Chitinophagaceae bacterium]
MKKAFLSSLLMLGLLQQGSAQVDPHFSQFYAHPLWLNPALTGAFEGKLRASAIYRSQWANVSPYNTVGISADLRTDDNLNIGVAFLQQSAGDGGYHYQNGGISMSYSGVRFGADGAQQLFIGMQVGFLGRSFDPDGLRYGSQWSPGTGYDPTRPPGDNSEQSSSGALDIAAGATWIDTRSDALFQPFAGISAGHLTQPEDPFFKGSTYHLPLRLTAHGGFRYQVGETARLQVQLLYMRQGSAEERMAGAGINLAVSDETELHLGGSYRIGDAVSPYVGVRHGALSLGASYDHTVSGLGKLAGNTNAFELSLTWIVPGEDGYSIPCPRF